MTGSIHDRARTLSAGASTLLGAAALAGIALAFMIGYALRVSPDRSSTLVFYRLFADFESWGAGILGLFAASLLYRRSTRPVIEGRAKVSTDMARGEVAAVAFVAAFAVSVCATMVFDAYPLSMDEFGATFQARLFASGRLAAPIPDSWRGNVSAITPVFISVRESDSAWVSPYLPGNALIRAPFEVVGSGWLAGAILASLSIIVIAEIARVLWPSDRAQQRVAVYVLALSPQFLLTAATPYAMTAHLAVNLLWLLAWIRGARLALLCGPLGALGLLLHQPVPHMLFALPFLLVAAKERRWTQLAWIGSWYLGAMLLARAWYDWSGFTAATGGLSAVIAMPHFMSFATMLMNAFLLLSWQTPGAALALLLTGASWRSMDRLSLELIAGLGFALVFYLFFLYVSQGHGWGWRYGHQMMGNVALLAGMSWPMFSKMLGERWARRAALVSLAMTLSLQYPLRIWQARRLAHPFARASSWIRSRDADIVIIPADSIWYGRDLVRNEPMLPRPVVISTRSASRIAGSWPSSARIERVSVEQLLAFGLVRASQP